PGTTSLADSHNFFYPNQAGLVLLLAVLACLVARAESPGPSAPSPAPAPSWPRISAHARPALAVLLSAALGAPHAPPGLALASAVAALALAEALGRRTSARRLAFLTALPVVALLLAALWPYYPVLGLLRVFARPELRGPLAGVAGGTAE